MSSVPGLSTALGMAFALQENDTALSDFTLAILRLNENDFLDELKRRWWDFTNKCSQQTGTRVLQLTFVFIHIHVSLPLGNKFLNFTVKLDSNIGVELTIQARS